MPRIAYVDGHYVPLAQAGVHVEDRGYQFADAVYEVFGLRNGRMLDEEEHLDRYERSLAALSISPPMSRAATKLVLRETIRRNHIKNGMVYFQLSRGQAARDHAFPPTSKPIMVVTVRPVSSAKMDKVHEKGIKIVAIPDERWKRCDIKTTALLPNVMARQYARESNAAEAWLIDDDGFITEGAATSAWIVDAKGVLRTRATGSFILAGVTRQVLLNLIKKNKIPFKESAFTLEEALAAKETFSTASILTVFPIVEINGQKIGNGKPGMISKKLLAAYQAIQF